MCLHFDLGPSQEIEVCLNFDLGPSQVNARDLFGLSVEGHPLLRHGFLPYSSLFLFLYCNQSHSLRDGS